MSLPTSQEPASRRVAVRSPGIDVYTVLLIISVVALLIGILLFVLELNAYNWELKPGAAAPWRPQEWLGMLVTAVGRLA